MRHFGRVRRTVGRHGFLLVVLVPAVLWVLVFRYFPIAYLADMSLHSGTVGRSKYVGLGNYREALSDGTFHMAVLHTVEYTVILVIVQLSLALLIAVGINSLGRQWIRQTVLTLYFLPLVASTAAMALVFVYIYDPIYGVLNYGLTAVGLPAQGYLHSPTQALYAVVAMSLWKGLGFPVIIYLAALLAIPRELIEATTIDGAGAWHRFWRLTIPLLRPTTILLVVIQGVESLQVFTPVYVMTGTAGSPPGGPNNSTTVWSLQIFEEAFELNKLGYGAALAVLMFIIVGTVMLFQIKKIRSGWKY